LRPAENSFSEARERIKQTLRNQLKKKTDWCGKPGISQPIAWTIDRLQGTIMAVAKIVHFPMRIPSLCFKSPENILIFIRWINFDIPMKKSLTSSGTATDRQISSQKIAEIRSQ
jgi:hypothetical protein